MLIQFIICEVAMFQTEFKDHPTLKAILESLLVLIT